MRRRLPSVPWGCSVPSPQSVPPKPGDDSPTVTLRQAAQARQFLVGAAVFPEGLKDEAYAGVLAREFNALTPENAMKWEPSHPSLHGWRFEAAHRLVEFAAKHRMKVT